MKEQELFEKVYKAHKDVFDEIFLTTKGEIPSGIIKVKNPDLTFLVNNGIVKLSDKIFFKYKNKKYICELVEDEDYSVKIQYGEEQFSSISTAIEKICNWHTNGWKRGIVIDSEDNIIGALDEIRKNGRTLMKSV